MTVLRVEGLSKSFGGVQAVMFGHLHLPVRATLDGKNGPVAALGAGAASAVGRRKAPGHYHVIEIDGGVREKPMISVRHRHYDPDGGRFTGGEEHAL